MGIGYVVLIWCVVVFFLIMNMFLPDEREVRAELNFIKFVYSFIKVVLFTSIHFILIPMYIGCVFDFITLDFVGSTLESRIDYMKVEPSSFFVL